MTTAPTQRHANVSALGAPPAQLLLVEGVAAVLKGGCSTVCELLRDQRLPSIEVGGSRRVFRAAAEALLGRAELEHRPVLDGAGAASRPEGESLGRHR